MSLAELEQRIALLEDIEAIKRLKARYCLYVEDKNEEAWISLFAQDAVWEGGSFGSYQGREAIRGLFRNIPNILHFWIHYVTNPIIEVRGGSATGQWYLLEPCTFAQGEQAVWGAARYEEEYVKSGGEWKFRKVKLISWFWTPFDQGWAKKRFAQE